MLKKSVFGRCAALGLGVAVSVAGFGACEDEDSAMSLSRFEVAHAEALCDSLVRCDHSFGDVKAVAAFARAAPQACPAWVVEALGRDPGSPMVLAAQGRATFVADRAEACVQATRDSCALDPWSLTECRAVFVGASPAGGACASSIECAPGLECDRTDTCGRCEPGPSLTTVEAGLGQECGFVEGGDTLRVCGAQLVCGQSGVCEGQVADGQPCTRTEQCRGASVCLSDIGQDEVCGVIPVRELGQSCSNEDGEGFGLCNRVKGLSCQDGTCVQLGDGAEGSVCAPGDEVPCDLGLTCDGGTARCVPRKPAGAACELDRDCESGTCEPGAGGATCAASCG